jgi:hypothetical protein
VPNLLAVQRIALFGENVHILYVAEMTRHSMLLLSALQGTPKKSTLAYVIFTPAIKC